MTSPRQWRIASLQPSISIVLDRLGRLDTLVACTRYCLEAVPALRDRKLRVVADSWSSKAEEILSASPNLVVASVPYRAESFAAILKTGCPVLALAPHTLADIYQDIRMLGGMLGAADEAEALVGEMLAGIGHVRAHAAQAPVRPLVYCEEWGKPLIHSQPWVAELVEAAGGTFLGTPGAVTGPDPVAEADPDVLVFAWCGARDRVPLERVVAQRNWGDLRAAGAGRVYCIPDELLNTPAPTLLGGLHALAGAIHPEIFALPPGARAIRAGAQRTVSGSAASTIV